MSPDWVNSTTLEYRFPRVSGDEPSRTRESQPGAWFSPRERG